MHDRWLDALRRLLPPRARRELFDPALADLRVGWLGRRQQVRTRFGRQVCDLRHFARGLLLGLECVHLVVLEALDSRASRPSRPR